MNLSDYRHTYSWQSAIELGRPLTKLTEELPSQENHGLITAIQGLMIDLPAAIAEDLISNGNSRQRVILRLESALELIESVYPALDTANSKQMLDELVERCTSDNFNEKVSAPLKHSDEIEIDNTNKEDNVTEEAFESV